MAIKTNETLRIKTAAGNDYLVARGIPQVLLLHPVLNYLMETHHDAAAVKKWLDTLPPDADVEIEERVTASKDELLYYYKYYLYLEQNGYFKQEKKEKLNDTSYSPEAVEFYLANCRHIVFEVCDTCGLDCKYCGYGVMYGGYDEREGKMMNTAMAKRFYDYMLALQNSPIHQKAHQPLIISFYGGEPTDNIALIKEMVRYCGEKNHSQRPLIFAMTTNGLSLHKHMDYLVGNRFQIHISLDGNETNNAYRLKRNGTPSFDTVFNNILKLKEKHPHYFKHFVNFISVLHDRNSRNEVVAFFRRHFGKEPRLSELTRQGIKPEKLEQFKRMYKQHTDGLTEKDYEAFVNGGFRSALNPFNEYLFHFLRANSGFVFRSYDKLLGREPVVRRIVPGTCHPFDKKAFLTVNGKLLPCERIHQTYALGSVTKDSVVIDPKEIARTYNSYYGKMKEKCNHCYRFDFCPTCLFMLNLEAERPKCDAFMDEKTFKGELARSMSLLEKLPHYYSRIMNEYVRF